MKFVLFGQQMVKRTGKMASIQKRGNSFRVRIFRKSKPSISNTFNNRHDAEKWARLIEVQLEQGTYIEKSITKYIPEEITIQEAIDRHIKSHVINKSNSRSEIGILQILSKKWVDRKLNSISKIDVIHLRDELVSLNRASSTINHYYNAISKLFQTAINEWGVPLDNPTTAIRRAPEPIGRMKRFCHEAELIFLKECSGFESIRLREIVIVAIETGMRCGELLTMRWEDIDLKNRKVLLRKTKNGCSRNVPLSSRALSTLNEIYKVDSHLVVFPFNHWELRRQFNKVLNICKEKYTQRPNPFEDIRFHDLRHEAISRLSDKGLNVIELSYISGHKTLSMLKRYTHPDLMTLINKIDGN
jgi:integrase